MGINLLLILFRIVVNYKLRFKIHRPQTNCEWRSRPLIAFTGGKAENKVRSRDASILERL